MPTERQRIDGFVADAKKGGASDQQIFNQLVSSNNLPNLKGFIADAKKGGASDSDIAQHLGLKLQKDLGTQQPIKFKAYDWKAEQKKALQQKAKEEGKTQFWQSGLLGASDLGAGVIQGVSKLADTISSGVNKVTGTNLDTNSYNRVTQQRKEIVDWHNLKRDANGQGFDGGRLLGQVVSTAPIALTGGGGLAAAAGRGALTGGAIGATSYAKDSNERFNNTAMGGVGGAAGGALGSLIGKGATKAINAYKNNLQKGAKEVVEQGEKHGVRTSVGDAGGNPHIQRTETVLDRIPIIGTSKFREAQQVEVANAAKKVVSALKNKISDVDYKSLNKIQSAALSGDKNAMRIMDVVKSTGDNPGKIMQAAAEIKKWRGERVASQLYDRVQGLAGNSPITPTNTIQAIDNVIAKDSKVVPNKELLNEIISIRNNLTDPTINVNFSELRAARSRLGELVQEWGSSNKSTSGLTKIRSAIDNDTADFAMNSGKPALVSEYKRADSFYKQLQESKDGSLAEAMTSNEPDQIYKTFIQFGKGDKASNFYRNLDPKGQAALRFEMTNQALSKATNEGREVFSPAKFANEFERLREPYKNIFSGADKAEMDGFIKLMRHVEQAGQYSSNPTNGSMVILPASGIGLAKLAMTEPLSAAASVGSIYGISKLFTTATGRRILLAAKDLPPGSEGLSNLLKMAEKLSTTTGANLTKSNQ